MKTHDWLSALLICALCGLSTATSGVGLWWVFDHNIELVGLSVAYAIAATTLLQALIFYFWDKAATSRGLIRTSLAGLFGILVSLSSAGFASGSYVYMFNKSGLEAHRTTRNAGTVSNPPADFNRELRGFAMRMDDISSDAGRKAEVEENAGGTCLGDKPQKTCGLRCRLRQRHARESAELAGLARSLSGNAVDIIADLQGDPSREGMLGAFRSAQSLVSSPKLSHIASWLRRETDGFSGQFFDADTGRTFVCRDPALEKKMRTAVGVITAGFRLPDLPPEPAQIGFRDAIGKSYSDAFELARMLMMNEFDPQRLESLSYSYAGYSPAIAVELLIVVLIFFRVIGRRDRGYDLTDEELFGADRRDLPPAVRQRNHRWINMILGSLIEDRRGWFVARPIDGSPDVAASWARMALIRKLPVDPDLNPAIPLADPDLYPEWVAARAEIHGGARRFALHPITKGQLEWLRRAAADLEAELENESDPTPPRPPDGNIVDLHSQRGESARVSQQCH